MKKIAKCFVKKITEENQVDEINWLPNPHSTGRLMLGAKMTIFGKIMVRVFTKDLRIESPSTSGEFIR